MDAFVVSFGVIAVAELGDKTQLMVLAFATRYRPLPVAIGVAVASGLVMAISVLVGAGLGALIPTGLVQLLGGAAFLAFAAWTLWSAAEHADEADPGLERPPQVLSGRRIAVIVGSTFLLAELGDKSMLAAVTLGAQGDPIGTWAGATLAEIGVNLIAILVGRQLGSRIPGRLVRLLAAALFAIFGVLLIADALIADALIA